MIAPLFVGMVVLIVFGVELLERKKRFHWRPLRVIGDVLGTLLVFWGALNFLAGVFVSIQGEDWGWLPAFGAAAIGIVAYIVLRRSRRPMHGHCLRCGYDLTGNTSGVCSECGEKTQTAKPPPAISE